MKPGLMGIFAHPDDETFGPCAALLREAKAGTQLHLITLTGGENGTNLDAEQDLGSIRLKEWAAACDMLGATTKTHLGYVDGQLGNLAMIDIAAKLEEIIKNTTANAPADTEIELMTLDMNGMTGHIDHIVAARATVLAFRRLKATDKRLTRVRLNCLPDTVVPTANVDWIYQDAGRTASEINETINGLDLKDEIIKLMETHRSQRADMEHVLARGDEAFINYFIDLT